MKRFLDVSGLELALTASLYGQGGSILADTIYDIARKAGVSITTVSRVLNGNYPVSEATRLRVQEVIGESGYSPSHVARSLATSTTSTLGVIGSGITNPYFVEMLQAIQRSAAQHSLQILLQDTPDAKAEIASVRLLLDRRVDGIIFVAHHENADNYNHILDAARRVPVVVVGQPLRGGAAYCVRADEEQGAFSMTKQLLGLGHRRFAFLGGNARSFSTVVKLRGIEKALSEVGHCTLEKAFTGYAYESVQEQLPSLIQDGLVERCTAIVAVSDYVAISALDVLHSLGISVPQTVSITGFDNVFWTRSVRPTLTTVDPQKHLLAEAAVEVFLKASRGEKKLRKNTVVPTQVVPRSSHGVPETRV